MNEPIQRPTAIDPPVLTELANELDRQLLDIVKNGREVIDSNGCPVCDESGRPVRRAASAADLKAAMERLRMCGVTAVPVQGSPLGSLAAEMEAKGFKLRLPELSDGPDSAVGKEP